MLENCALGVIRSSSAEESGISQVVSLSEEVNELTSSDSSEAIRINCLQCLE